MLCFHGMMIAMMLAPTISVSAQEQAIPPVATEPSPVVGPAHRATSSLAHAVHAPIVISGNADLTNGDDDGICDMPYTIDGAAGAADFLPLKSQIPVVAEFNVSHIVATAMLVTTLLALITLLRPATSGRKFLKNRGV